MYPSILVTVLQQDNTHFLFYFPKYGEAKLEYREAWVVIWPNSNECVMESWNQAITQLFDLTAWDVGVQTGIHNE